VLDTSSERTVNEWRAVSMRHGTCQAILNDDLNTHIVWFTSFMKSHWRLLWNESLVKGEWRVIQSFWTNLGVWRTNLILESTVIKQEADVLCRQPRFWRLTSCSFQTASRQKTSYRDIHGNAAAHNFFLVHSIMPRIVSLYFYNRRLQ
jgi:hypothetical protein